MCDKLLTFRNFKVFDVGSVSENFSNIFRGYFFIKSDFMPHSRSFFTFYPKKDIFKIILSESIPLLALILFEEQRFDGSLQNRV